MSFKPISLLKLINVVKRTQTSRNLSALKHLKFWKKKGKKSDLENDRGVFNVTKIRSILDRMIYNDVYDIIDSNMSCSNIGARKNRNIRDHLFVVNGILNDVMHNKNAKPIDIGIYDAEKCFDKLEYVNTANDLYKAGVQDDRFVLIANSNKNCNVAVKTPWGSVTERTILNNIEMQGTVLAPLKCFISIDTIGKETLENKHGNSYKYKNCVSIPPLSLIDDIITVSECSTESVSMNAYIQAKIAGKRLKLGYEKCFQMHVGKQSICCPALSLSNKEMKKANKEKYLGNYLSSDSRIDYDIQQRYNKGVGIVNQIIGLLKEVSFGHYYFEMALLFRNSMLINGILCSVDALYGITNTHIEQLEQCDRMLMRKLFSSVSTTAIEAYYFELGMVLPLRFIIIAKRLMFYWAILHKGVSELVTKVYEGQKLSPVKNDWFLQIQSDLKYCNIDLSEEEIRNMKEMKFKTLVKKNIQAVCCKYPEEQKNRLVGEVCHFRKYQYFCKS